MNDQYQRIKNPLYNPMVIGGEKMDIFYVLTRNIDDIDRYGEYQKNYIFIDEIPKKDILQNINCIKFMNGIMEKDVIEKIPDWLYELNSIYYLAIPINLFLDEKFVKSNVLPKLTILDIMYIDNTETMIDIDCTKFSNLKRLMIWADNYRLINTEFAKNIEVFSINLRTKAKDELSKIKFLPQVKVLRLDSIYTKLNLSVLSELKLTGLYIQFNFHKKQSLLSILDTSELEYLFINNIAMPIDFEVFKSAKKLKEITIWNSKKFENIYAVADIKSLRALEICYCKFNPTDEEKAIIKSMNLDYLKVE